MRPSISRVHHLRLSHRQLEALAAHRLDEHRQLKLPPALHLPGVRRLGRAYLDRDVSHQLALQASSSWRPVSLSPDRPASGDVLTPIVIASAGSSTARRGSASGSSRSAIVSPIVTSAIPAMTTISPAPAEGTSLRSNPWVT